MLIYRYNPSGVTTSSGYWAGNTLYVQGMMLRQLYIKSATAGTTFDVAVEDVGSIEVRKIENIKGVVNDLIPSPVQGIQTIKINNASADEAFTVLLCFSET